METVERNYLVKKEWDSLFKDKLINDTRISVKTKAKELPKFIVEMALELSKLEYIKYIQLCDELLLASSMNYLKRPKIPRLLPRLKPQTEEAVGVEILYDLDCQEIDFIELCEVEEGQIFELLDAILAKLPENFIPVRDWYWSEEFLGAVQKRYDSYDWLEM